MSSGHHDEEGESHGGGGHSSAERYLVTYADLLTLLLAFFIVMWATSKADLEKFGKIAAAFNQVLGGSSASLTVNGGSSGGGGSGMGLLSGGSAVFPGVSQRSRDFAALSQQIGDYAQQSGIQPDIGINMRREGIVITLSNALLFSSGTAEISEASLPTLQRLAELLEPLPNEIRVEAHTDNVPTEDAAFTNWELSSLRAAGVVRFLIEVGGLAPTRLTAAGMGDAHPLFTNDTPEHRRLNRRADIVILYPQDEATRVFSVMSLPEVGPAAASPDSGEPPTSADESVNPAGS